MALHRWFAMLKLSQQWAPSWYRTRMREELRERRAAHTRWQKLSETSDVLFAILRAQNDGHPIIRPPPFYLWRNSLVYGYMVAKYTSRWSFYRMAARFCRGVDHRSVCEVVNPAKDHKLEEVALRHHMDPATFKACCRKLRRIWPLLP
ncbi:hypothetical protein IAQ61_007830 [Plenodomus lingam]|uniref:Uncharacterized protein n=1 Tax=Leptosphaeria maculans (strain JN3 / isolate v23.1.3 / race Av1-4-5-6-7-8) TaxID=985895 RepID=E5A4J1_LEPMJ|nr:hypothetical protein LEMA_P077780.1 [Plenodomus lingam JN3]KAH9867238.1 hypothetical protein IAQ61_007830 [Plenodomus lingam]CBX98539.1 hypothetical protein LEMA_P077780.1 [Plenodomus lingam JN3]